MKNRQRTSTRNRVLKAETVRDAAKMLTDRGINTVGDLRRSQEKRGSDDVATAWKAIKGQGSGISWHYLLMLCTIQGVKADRMITGWVSGHLERHVKPKEAARLVESAARRAGLDPIAADHRIWTAERGLRRDRQGSPEP